ncbi:MAG: helix-turn-helix domain-containing protein [Magnetococcales bacterium]|nr:helix-turn-helix domain-containing protein [Magnetococcales bacterium]
MTDLLTVAEAAAFLHLKPKTLNNWRTGARRRGPIYVPVGRKIFYSREDLVQWLNEQKVDPQSAWALRKAKMKEHKAEDLRNTLKLPRVRKDGKPF